MNNTNMNINGLNDGAGGGGTVQKSNGSNTRTFTMGNGDASGAFSGNISMTSGGSSTIAKTGAGTQTLSGTISTLGVGNINGGRLNINGSWNNGVNVNNGGTLGGTGSLTGAVTVNNGGKLSPGMSIESLNTGNLTFTGSANGTTLEIEIDTSNPLAPAADLLNVNGNLSFGSNVNLTVTDLAGASMPLAPGTKLTLISYAGGWNGVNMNTPDNSMVTVGANTFFLDYNDTQPGSNGGLYTGGFMTLTIPAPVPEASAFLFGALACGILPAKRLLKRRHAAS
jgi:hypothetical protein